MNRCLLCNNFFVKSLKFWQLFLPIDDSQVFLCSHCRARFAKLVPPFCPYCRKHQGQGKICNDCQNWRHLYSNKLLKHHASYRYNEAFHQLMVAYKRRGDYELRHILQELATPNLAHLSFDLYVPIPTSKEHRERRGFDTIIAIYHNLCSLTPLLKKLPGTGAQGEKNRMQRLASPQSFIIDQSYLSKANVQNAKRILLLDDIYTTGRTLYHARDQILQAFPQAQVESFSICR